jgi:hypothetical protein
MSDKKKLFTGGNMRGKYKRVILYAPPEQYIDLRLQLMKEQKAVSVWFRECLVKFMAKFNKKYAKMLEKRGDSK